MFDDTGGGDLDEVEDAFTSIGVLFGIGARDGMGGWTVVITVGRCEDVFDERNTGFALEASLI